MESAPPTEGRERALIRHVLTALVAGELAPHAAVAQMHDAMDFDWWLDVERVRALGLEPFRDAYWDYDDAPQPFHEAWTDAVDATVAAQARRWLIADAASAIWRKRRPPLREGEGSGDKRPTPP